MEATKEIETNHAGAQSRAEGANLTDVFAAKSKQEFVAMQFRQAMYQEGKKVQEVTCGCGLTMPLRFAYKCLYCGEFYCQVCAEHHFGKTRAEYNAEKADAEKRRHKLKPPEGA